MYCKNDISVISAVFLTPRAGSLLWVGVMLVAGWGDVGSVAWSVLPHLCPVWCLRART